MRRATGVALACGQNEGLIFRFRDLLLHEAVDYVQPNVVSSGGFTQCAKIAGLAAGFCPFFCADANGASATNKSTSAIERFKKSRFIKVLLP